VARGRKDRKDPSSVLGRDVETRKGRRLLDQQGIPKRGKKDRGGVQKRSHAGKKIKTEETRAISGCLRKGQSTEKRFNLVSEGGCHLNNGWDANS